MVIDSQLNQISSFFWADFYAGLETDDSVIGLCIRSSLATNCETNTIYNYLGSKDNFTCYALIIFASIYLCKLFAVFEYGYDRLSSPFIPGL